MLTKYRTRLSIIIFSAFACFSLLAVRVGSFTTSSLPAQSEVLQIDNKTQAFQIISSEINNGVVRLSLKNGYAKTINGFTLADSESSGIQIDFTATDSAIAREKLTNIKFPSEVSNLL